MRRTAWLSGIFLVLAVGVTSAEEVIVPLPIASGIYSVFESTTTSIDIGFPLHRVDAGRIEWRGEATGAYLRASGPVCDEHDFVAPTH